MNQCIVLGIASAIMSITFFVRAHIEAMNDRPFNQAFIERDGARAYFTNENMNDMWKFVEKDDTVKIAPWTTWEPNK